MLPKPFFRPLSNPLLEQVINLSHGKVDVLLHIFRLGNMNGGAEVLHEMNIIGAVFAPPDNRWNDRNIKTPRQLDGS